jgi:hypothetical protein
MWHASTTTALVADADVCEVQGHSRHHKLRTLTLYDDKRADLVGRVRGSGPGSSREPPGMHLE